MVAGGLVVLAGSALELSIAHSRYDPQENRAPTARIVWAVLALVPALVAVGLAARRDRTRRVGLYVAAVILGGVLFIVWGLVKATSGET